MVRQAQTKDIPRIAEIIVFGKRVAYRPIFRNDEVSFNELQVWSMAEEYLSSPDKINNMRVYDDGIIRGVINFIDYGEAVELCDFYVDPFFKGKGFGRALIKSLIAEARSNGKKRIFLWVIKDNLSARKFYEKNGFRASGQERLIDGTPIWDMHYEVRFV